MTKRLTRNEVINQIRAVHGDKYDYSLLEYVNSDTKFKIICPEHGVFEKTKVNICNNEQGCPKCIDRGKGCSFHFLEYYMHSEKGKELGHYYKIRLFYKDEIFYKIGITSRDIKKRYQKNTTACYEWELIEDNIMTNLECALQEKLDSIKLKHLKYTPKNKFPGWTECYKSLDF